MTNIYDGTHPILVFHAHNPLLVDIVYCDPRNLPLTDTWFVFKPINGDTCAQHYSFNSSGYFLRPEHKHSGDNQ